MAFARKYLKVATMKTTRGKRLNTHKAQHEQHRDGLLADALEGRYHVDDQEARQAEHKAQHARGCDGLRAEVLAGHYQ
eukprot:10913753-Alexandrium_andersonii.AAC.2